MILYQLLLLQFIAHLLGDFVFQPHMWALKKKQKVFSWHHIWHVLVIFIFSLILSLDFGFLPYAILLTAIHLITDILKSYFQINGSKKDSFYFFFDQAIHIICFVSISVLYSYNQPIDFIYDIPIKYLAIAFGFVLCAKPANIFIKNIFQHLAINIPITVASIKDENKDLPNAGKLIGLMERFLVLALILVGQYSAVGLIIAAKSILRFRDNKKNEYVLVGTLLSFGIATLLGIIISLISVK